MNKAFSYLTTLKATFVENKWFQDNQDEVEQFHPYVEKFLLQHGYDVQHHFGLKSGCIVDFVATKNGQTLVIECKSRLSKSSYIAQLDKSCVTVLNFHTQLPLALHYHELDLNDRQNPRDSFGEYALIYTRLAEMVATNKLDNLEIVTLTMAMDIVWEVARLIHAQAEATAHALGMDLVTEKKLLPG
ncbi:MAG: hypothetical protein IPK17_18990 [Chloroflexi bacterium]|nr:hypothetical protein [Chloroflexota bacterium]